MTDYHDNLFWGVHPEPMVVPMPSMELTLEDLVAHLNKLEEELGQPLHSCMTPEDKQLYDKCGEALEYGCRMYAASRPDLKEVAVRYNPVFGNPRQMTVDFQVPDTEGIFPFEKRSSRGWHKIPLKPFRP